VENPLDVTILLWVQGWEKKKKKKKREKKRAKVALSIAPPPKNFKPRGWKPITPEGKDRILTMKLSSHSDWKKKYIFQKGRKKEQKQKEGEISDP